MKLFYTDAGLVKVFVVTSTLPAETVWNGGLPYLPDGGLIVTYAAVPANALSNCGLMQLPSGPVCVATSGTPYYHAGVAVTSTGALLIDTTGGIQTDPFYRVRSSLTSWYRPGNWDTATGASIWYDSITTRSETETLFTATSGVRASQPDTAGTSITGDISIMARVSFSSLTTADIILSKWNTTGNQRSYELRQTTAANLQLRISTAGTSATTLSISSTAAHAYAANEYFWVMVTLDVDDGAGNNVAKFYTAPDQEGLPWYWTQLGSTVTTAGTTSIYDSTAILCVGDSESVTTSHGGGIKRARVYTGIVAADGTGGTCVSDYNPTTQSAGATSFADSVSGQNWTLAGTSVTSGTRPGRHLRQPTAAVQPAVITHSGTNFLYFGVNSSNTLTTPTKTITGDFTIEFDIQLPNWTNPVAVPIFYKQSGNDGFSVRTQPTGKMAVLIYDGTGSFSCLSNSATGFTDGTRHTVKFVWQDGVGGTWYFDGVQDGAQVPIAKTLTNSATAMTIASGTATATAELYSMSLTNGAGTTYYSIDFSALEGGRTSYTANGDTWTLTTNGIRHSRVVASPQLSSNNTDDLYMRASYPSAHPITRVVRFSPTAYSLNSKLLSGIAYESAIQQSTSTPKISLLNNAAATADNSNATIDVRHVVGAVWNGASSSIKVDDTAVTTGTVGAGDPAGLTIFAGNTLNSANFWQGYIEEMAEFDGSALTSAELVYVMDVIAARGQMVVVP